MDAMLHVEHGIPEAFREAFPGMTFVRSTFYKVRGIYHHAQVLDILHEYIAHGESERGLWSEMRKRVDELLEDDAVTVAATEDKASPHEDGMLEMPVSRDVTDQYMGDITQQTVQAMKECVGFHPFGCQDKDPIEDSDGYRPSVCMWMTPGSTFTLTMESTGKVVGRKKDCMRWVSQEGLTEVPYIGKHFHGHVDSKQDGLIIEEALRIGEAAVWWDRFASLAFDYGVRLPTVTFVQGYVWRDTSPKGLCWYAQDELTEGIIREVTYPLGIPGDLLSLEDTLNAFTHFGYTETKGREIFVDFQGFQHGNVLTVFDCTRNTELAVQFTAL
ncbi:hypothetical protein K439DRAFT_1614171 [Ramaria rubella]|nr:hypothetical protein K439DRAFT_1614171 [Ramaria rubella]